MKCRLLHIRIFAEWLAIIFFATSVVLCLSVYLNEDRTGLFTFERTTLLTAAIVHGVLCILALLSCLYTAKLLKTYVSNEDEIYNGLIDLLGLVERAVPVDIEAEEEGSVIVYREPTEISHEGVIEPGLPLTETKDVLEPALFSFIYTPGKNLPEKMSYKDSFMTKLSPNVDLESLVLGEDPYPKIFATEIVDKEEEKKRSSTLTQKIEGNPLGEVWPKNPKFVFTYKNKGQGQSQCQESLMYNDKFITKLPASLDLEEMIFKNLEDIQEIIDTHVNKQ